MLIPHLWGSSRGTRSRLSTALISRLRRPGARRARTPLSALDRRVLSDLGIDPGTIVSLARDFGVPALRRPPGL